MTCDGIGEPHTNRGEAESGGFVRILAIGPFVLVALVRLDSAVAQTWRGLEVAPENRCSPYDKKADYP